MIVAVTNTGFAVGIAYMLVKHVINSNKRLMNGLEKKMDEVIMQLKILNERLDKVVKGG